MEAYETEVEKFVDWMGEADTDPTISAYMAAALTDRQFPTEMIHHSCAQAARDQTRIGWDNLLFGRLATNWMMVQAEHLRDISSRKSPERWAADMAYRLLQLSHAMWTALNGILHERDQQGLLLSEGQNLREAITEWFLKGHDGLLPADYHLVDIYTLDELLQRPPSEKYTWLGAIKLAHKVAEETNRSEVGQQRMSLSNWFRTGQCRPNTGQTGTSTTQAEDDDELTTDDEEEEEEEGDMDMGAT